jgi:Zn-dependent protease with chaperone function
MHINLKLYYFYLALIIVIALHATQTFAEDELNATEHLVNVQSDILETADSNNEKLANPDETNYSATQAVTLVENDEIDPVEDISSFYSDIEMRMRLAVKANAQPCSIYKCEDNQAFDARVLLIGESLSNSAYILYPELKKTVPKFDFEVVDKKVLGTASNASGKVVLFRPIQALDLDDNAIAFIIGREMGHVIANHHKSNAKTKIFFTVLTSVLFPAATLISASSAAAQATTATTLMTSAASTVTSIVGSEVALSRIKPGQLSEADNISLTLLEYGGVTSLDTAQSLEFIVKNENSIGWEKDLNLSISNVRQLAGESHEIVVEFEPLPEPDDGTYADMVDHELLLADEIKQK